MIWGTPILGNQRPLSEEHSSAIAFPSNLRATAEYFFAASALATREPNTQAASSYHLPFLVQVGPDQFCLANLRSSAPVIKMFKA